MAGDYSDLFGAAALGAVDHYVNQKAPVVKSLGSNAMLADLAVLGASVFYPRVFGRYSMYGQGAAAGASYAITRRLITHVTGQSTTLDTARHMERVAEDATPQPEMQREETLLAANF